MTIALANARAAGATKHPCPDAMCEGVGINCRKQGRLTEAT